MGYNQPLICAMLVLHLVHHYVHIAQYQLINSLACLPGNHFPLQRHLIKIVFALPQIIRKVPL